MKNFKRSLGAFLALMTLILLLPVQAMAAGSIDLDHAETLTISYQDGDIPLAGAEFSIYLVATMDEYGELTATDQFSQFHVNIRGKDDEARKTLASTLEGYVLRDAVAPTDSGKTDKEGLLTLPTGEDCLGAGLYLVLGSRHTRRETVYNAQPFMVMLPALDKEANDWIYDVVVHPKFEKHDRPGGSGDDTITRKVLKVWDDDRHEEDRPKEVVVQLLRDGKVYDTVTLNKGNNWRHTWSKLDNDYAWTVVEQELDHYYAQVDREGVTFVVTNTYTEDIPDNPPPTEPTPPPEPTQPTEPTPSKPDAPKPNTPTLPQTGQLWWPVPVLVAAGLLLVIAGLIRRRGAENEK